VEYDILVSHGVASFSRLERWRTLKNAEESMPCAPSTKIKPDSRATSAGMTMQDKFI
jgi:hypothetical protein